jgi:hypothetical protein
VLFISPGRLVKADRAGNFASITTHALPSAMPSDGAPDESEMGAGAEAEATEEKSEKSPILDSATGDDAVGAPLRESVGAEAERRLAALYLAHHGRWLSHRARTLMHAYAALPEVSPCLSGSSFAAQDSGSDLCDLGHCTSHQGPCDSLFAGGMKWRSAREWTSCGCEARP